MKLRIHKPDRPAPHPALLILCETLDRAIPTARTVLLAAGVVAAAMRTGRLADFIFALGLLFQFAISFGVWWHSKKG